MSPKYQLANETYNQLTNLKSLSYGLYQANAIKIKQDYRSEFIEDFGCTLDASVYQIAHLFEINRDDDYALNTITDCIFDDNDFDYLLRLLKFREII